MVLYIEEIFPFEFQKHHLQIINFSLFHPSNLYPMCCFYFNLLYHFIIPKPYNQLYYDLIPCFYFQNTARSIWLNFQAIYFVLALRSQASLHNSSLQFDPLIHQLDLCYRSIASHNSFLTMHMIYNPNKFIITLFLLKAHSCGTLSHS